VPSTGSIVRSSLRLPLLSHLCAARSRQGRVTEISRSWAGLNLPSVRDRVLVFMVIPAVAFGVVVSKRDGHSRRPRTDSLSGGCIFFLSVRFVPAEFDGVAGPCCWSYRAREFVRTALSGPPSNTDEQVLLRSMNEVTILTLCRSRRGGFLSCPE